MAHFLFLVWIYARRVLNSLGRHCACCVAKAFRGQFFICFAPLRFPPPLHEILRSRRPVGKPELKARLKQTAWYNAAAFQDQFSFRPDKDRSNFQHPFRCRKADAAAPSMSQGTHKFAVRQRSRRGNVHTARYLFLGNQMVDGPNKVCFMNPRHELTPRAGGSPETKSDEAQQSIEYA